jgi:transcriptional regulator with XRE-family HTH domain
MDGRAIVAWNLRRLRVARAISQERLAFDSGVDRAYLGSLERGDRNPTVDVLDKLAATLDVPLAELFIAPPAADTAPPRLRPGRRPKAP